MKNVNASLNNPTEIQIYNTDYQCFHRPATKNSQKKPITPLSWQMKKKLSADKQFMTACLKKFALAHKAYGLYSIYESQEDLMQEAYFHFAYLLNAFDLARMPENKRKNYEAVKAHLYVMWAGKKKVKKSGGKKNVSGVVPQAVARTMDNMSEEERGKYSPRYKGQAKLKDEEQTSFTNNPGEGYINVNSSSHDRVKLISTLEKIHPLIYETMELIFVSEHNEGYLPLAVARKLKNHPDIISPKATEEEKLAKANEVIDIAEEVARHLRKNHTIDFKEVG